MTIKNHETIRDLKLLAKQRGIKLKRQTPYVEIRAILGLEPKDYPTRYNHCVKRKEPIMVKTTNAETGEEVEYSSIAKLSKAIGVFPGSITYRIKKGTPLIIDDVEYKITKK